MPRPVLEVADIFRSHGSAWRKANAGHVSLGQLKAMAAIEACRTAELGGHVAACEDCAHTVVSYNSCVMCTSSNGELTCLLPHFPVHRRAFTLHYEARRSNASSLSVGWNVPRRRCGGTIASIASSFSAGSPRV